MRKSWFFFLVGFLSIALGGIVLASGDDSTSSKPSGTQEIQDSAKDHGGLTPRRKSEKPVILAQQPSTSSHVPSPPKVDPHSPLLVATAPSPAPVLAEAQPVSDNYVFAELERLSAEVAKLKKDTKKPDTKKAWSTPKLSGRLFLDAYTADQDGNTDAAYGNLKNKAGLKEMQFAITGNGFDAFDYKMELSLAPDKGRVNLVDNWIGVKNLPLFGYVRAGHFKPETGLSYPASALHTTLTEFSGPSSTFGLGRRFGVSSENLFANDRIRLFYGIFQEGATNENRYIEEDNQGQVFNMRLSAAPVYAEEGRNVLHLGGHWSYVSPKNGTTNLSAKFGQLSWLATSLKTGDFDNNHHHRGGVEVAWQHGAFAIQSEAFFNKYSSYGNSSDRTATGAYVELKYFLTGEHRTYSLNKGMFGAAKVRRNFHPFKCGEYNLVDGFGAWQAVLQYSYLDLGDWRSGATAGNRLGGRQHDVTLGLNWFWTSNIRWIFEYVHSQQNIGSDRLSCHEDLFGTSIRVHF